MTPQRWNQVQELFDSASAIEPASREEFLRRECEGDEKLIAEVRSLLACRAETSEYLETPAINLQTIFSETVKAQADLLDPMLGRELASYTILSRLGTGGMGVVYLAEQRSPRRTVALKLIRPGLASPSLLKRFDHEAQALGRLKHPGIAQIYEAGTAHTPLGVQPYFAMEYVAGQPLLEYADQQELGAGERLELVARICDAVQHAHSKGVIHRDIKPANVLVEGAEAGATPGTSDQSHGHSTSPERERAGPTNPTIHPLPDGRGSLIADRAIARTAGGAVPKTPAATTPRRGTLAQPKILDFGVARVADSDSPAATIDASTAQIVGTLPYMSPEQLGVGPTGTPLGRSLSPSENIDTRTDVYALGVLAYELLTGRLPHDLHGKSLTECARILSESDVVRASSTHRHLRGDVDTILLKALEKDPSRRYQSPAALAEDIRRSLSNQPILARPQTAGYQLRKLVVRHRIPSVLIGAILLLVVTAAVWMSVLYARANSLRTQAEEETRKTGIALQAEAAQAALAQRKELASHRVTAVLIDAFRQTDPTLHLTKNADAKEFFAREILSVGAARVISDLNEEPTLQASLLEAFGEIYNNIGVFDHGEELLERCLEVRRTLGQTRELVYANALMDLASCVHQGGNTVRAVTLAEEAVSIYTEKLRPDDPKLSRTISQLGLYYLIADDLDKATRAFEQAGIDSAGTPGHGNAFQAMRFNGIAGVLNAKGQTREAEEVLRKAIDLSLVDSSPDSVIISSLRNNLAWVLYNRGKFAEGIEQANLALASRRTIYPGTHAKISDSLLVLGVLTAESGYPLLAEPMLREALRIRLAGVPDGKSLIGEAQAALASCLGYLRRFDEGDTLMTQGVANLRAGYGDHHVDTQLALRHAVDFYESCEKPERAAEYRPLVRPAASR